VLGGDFGGDALEDVVGTSDAAALVASLVDKSLVRTLRREGEVRFALFETIRELAAAELEAAGEAQATLARCAAHYVALAERLAAADAARRLAAEEDAMSGVVRLLAASDRPRAREDALRLLVALQPVRFARRPIGAYASEIRALLSDGVPGALAARATLVLAAAHLELGDAQESRALYVRALEAAPDRATEGRALAGLGRLDANQGRWREALERFERARAIALEVGDAWLRTLCEACLEFHGTELAAPHPELPAMRAAKELFRDRGDEPQAIYWALQRGRALAEYGNHELAGADIGWALERARAIGDLRGEGMALFADGTLAIARRRFAEAAEKCREAVAVLRGVGAVRYEGYASGHLAVGLHASGAFDEAEQRYGEAMDLLAHFGDVPNMALFRMCRGALYARRGRIDEARRELDAVRALIDAKVDLSRARALHVHEGQIEAALARARFAAGDAEGAKAALAKARARLDEATAPTERGARGALVRWVDTSLEVLVAAEVLAQTLDDLVAPRAALVVAADGSAFRPPDGARASLERRRPLRRLLVALARARIDRPGEALGQAELVAAGWPGERLPAKTAANRLHVALDALRKAGLVIERTERGWRLPAEVPLAWSDRF
jgi:tetratricopeptide (TPR) repeat protein